MLVVLGPWLESHEASPFYVIMCVAIVLLQILFGNRVFDTSPQNFLDISRAEIMLMVKVSFQISAHPPLLTQILADTRAAWLWEERISFSTMNPRSHWSPTLESTPNLSTAVFPEIIMLN